MAKDPITQLLDLSKEASEASKKMEAELVHLRRLTAHQGMAIAALNDRLEAMGIAAPAEPETIDLITMEATADIYGVHESTVRRWVKRGQLQPVRKGSKMYFRKCDLLK